METTRRTGRIFENTWTCAYCGRKNRGRDRECIGCGRPKSKEIKYEHQHIAVLEGEEAKPYLKGPDWFCECCESYNPADISDCKSCGAPKGASKNYFQIRKEQEESKQRRETVVQSEPVQEQKSSQAAEWRPCKWNILQPLLAGAGIVSAIFCLIWFIIWVATPEQKSGEIVDLTWKSSISLQELVTEEGEGWDPPMGARIINQKWTFKETVQEIDYYEDQIVPVTKYKTVQDEDLVWYTYEDMGNGFDEEIEHRLPQSHQEPYTDYETQQVPVYKDVDVYDDWYWWEIDKWVTVDTKTNKGSKGTEKDPELTAHGSKQRTTGYSRSFRIYIHTDNETEDFVISKDLYDKMEIGDEIIYETNKLGLCKILEINGIAVE